MVGASSHTSPVYKLCASGQVSWPLWFLPHNPLGLLGESNEQTLRKAPRPAHSSTGCIHSSNTYSRYAYGLPRWLSGKESAHNEGELGFIPGLGRSPGEEDGNPLQYSCLKNPMDRGASLAIILGVAKVQHNLVTRQINKKKRYGT